MMFPRATWFPGRPDTRRGRSSRAADLDPVTALLSQHGKKESGYPRCHRGWPLPPHKLRGVILMIAEKLLNCNRFFQTLKERWVTAGMDQRAMCVRAAKRFCQIAYQVAAGGRTFRHLSCQKRGVIFRKLSCFHVDHGISIVQVMTDLLAATATRIRLEITSNAPARPGDKTRRTHQKELSCRKTDFVSTPTTCSPCVNRLC
jgi:hypothetical protein